MNQVGIIGAGTMGAGIAQVAAESGWSVRLMDVSAERAGEAIQRVGDGLRRLVDKGKRNAEQVQATLGRMQVAQNAAALCGCELIIEAIVEDLSAKLQSLAPLAAALPEDVIFASNTSSLSISALGEGLGVAPRTVGMHFFNPVPLMPLVEVIAGRNTADAVAARTFEIATAWGKTAVRVKDTPGFIVNRVARGYYLESLRMLDEGVAGVDEIDQTLKRMGGFRMGPFELMDLIGIDVNYAVSGSVWEQFGKPPRLTPHPLQQRLVTEGRLGRKSGRGFYDYSSAQPLPAIAVHRRSFSCTGPLYEAVRRVADAGAAPDAAGRPEAGSVTEQYVFARVLATVINEAALALNEQVASEADIDTAMRLGTNYPRGPLAWAQQIGRHTCAALLRRLNGEAADGRFEPAGWLA